MTSARLRDPYEMPLYILSVLANLLIIALILAGALLLGFANAPSSPCCSSCRAWSCIANSPARA
jgi:hypothetical protein